MKHFQSTFLFLFLLGMSSLQAQTLSQAEIDARVKAKAEKVAWLREHKAELQTAAKIYSSPEQDCPNAIPITQQSYTQTLSYSGSGNIPNEITPSFSCLGTGEQNDVWYVFVANNNTIGGFSITPVSPTDDYDWAVYDLTFANCPDIANNPTLEISCNFSPNIGCNGVTGPNGQTTGPCGGQNAALLPVVNGHTYLINVSNFSSSQAGYTIDFIGNVFGTPSFLAGKIYNDLNNNCTQDVGESGAGNQSLHIVTQNGNYNAFTLPNPNGNYWFWADTGAYQITINPPTYYNICTGSSASQLLTLVNFGDTAWADFAITPVANVNDLKIDLTAYNIPIPNLNAMYRIHYQNVGTTTQTADITFDYGSYPLTYLSSTVTPSGTSGNTLSWNIPNLAPLQSGNIDVTFWVDSLAQLNYTYTMVGNVFSAANDSTPLNNTDTLTPTVLTSYDPNFKEVSADKILQSQLNTADALQYTVHFQNTGAIAAGKIVVRDTLDNNLDISTLKMTGYSHAAEFTLNIVNGYPILTVTFNNIQLPDSATNELASHGFLKYEINAKTSLAIGDIISNRASIYFDFNAPVLTNTVQTEVVKTVSSGFISAAQAEVNIYPNPATESLFIDCKAAKYEYLEIRNVLGQIVFEAKTFAKETEVKVNNWQSGVYFLKMNTDKGVICQKIVVE
jgi:uncharacterized repeat protein (TIGR01451 family)